MREGKHQRLEHGRAARQREPDEISPSPDRLPCRQSVSLGSCDSIEGVKFNLQAVCANVKRRLKLPRASAAPENRPNPSGLHTPGL